MNATMMQEVLRITDRFMDRKDPDSIDRQGRLINVVVVVVIFHIIMGIAFVKMEEYERQHPHTIYDTNVAFELAAPPPDPTFKVTAQVPEPIALTEGENPNPGSASAPKPKEADKVSLKGAPPSGNAPKATPRASPGSARLLVARETTVAPPVAITKTTDVKAAPLQKPKTAPTAKPVPTDVVGATANTEKSGGPTAGGAPDGKEGGTGTTDGTGAGGDGKGEGDPGAGTGFGQAGGDIATRLPTTPSRAMGNITPYKKDMLVRIAKIWQPKRKTENMILLVEIGKDGTLLRCEVIESSGNKRADKEAVAAVEGTQFAALPDWYKGDSIPFKIELAKVEAARQE